ncbi:MAG: hypothetical protein KC416_10680, partial [Myxococcales bacterium]|nr:hypothetical protein [Myxococcales bacterium]
PRVPLEAPRVPLEAPRVPLEAPRVPTEALSQAGGAFQTEVSSVGHSTGARTPGRVPEPPPLGSLARGESTEARARLLEAIREASDVAQGGTYFEILGLTPDCAPHDLAPAHRARREALLADALVGDRYRTERALREEALVALDEALEVLSREPYFVAYRDALRALPLTGPVAGLDSR